MHRRMLHKWRKAYMKRDHNRYGCFRFHHNFKCIVHFLAHRNVGVITSWIWRRDSLEKAFLKKAYYSLPNIRQLDLDLLEVRSWGRECSFALILNTYSSFLATEGRDAMAVREVSSLDDAQAGVLGLYNTVWAKHELKTKSGMKECL